MDFHSRRRGFTLIELLIVVAVVAILAIVVVLTLNPIQLIKQSRDANRVSDMTTLNKAISLYYEDAINQPSTLFMGTSSIIYLSIPDPTATSSAGTNCAGLGLGLPATGYHCPASSTYRDTNGTGWIPIDFASSTIGSSIASLSVDPLNTTSSGEYYEYETDGAGNWQIVSAPESQKYSSSGSGGGFSGGTTSTLLSAIDVTFSTSTYNIVASTSPSLYGVAFDSHTDNVLVADGNSDAITTINDTTYATSSYSIPTVAYNIAFDSHNNTIWITSALRDGQVTVINDTTYAASTYAVGGLYPLGIAFDPHTNTIWVTNSGQGTVTAINDTTYAASTYAVGGLYPAGIAFDPHTNTIWVANGESNGVTAINDTTYVASTYATGLSSPYGIAFDPHTNTIWVANGDLNGVTAINDTTYATSSYSIPTTAGTNIAFDPHTDSIWIGGSGPVTQINDTTYGTSTYNHFIPFGIVFDSNTNAIWMSSNSQGWLTQFTPSH